jgi:hypothetical protein
MRQKLEKKYSRPVNPADKVAEEWQGKIDKLEKEAGLASEIS